MKKFLCMVLSFAVVCSAWITVHVSAEEGIPFLNDGNTYAKTTIIDFEESDSSGTITYTGANGSLVVSGRGQSQGELSVVPNNAENSVYVAFGGDSNITYHLSFLSTQKAMSAKVYTMQKDTSSSDSISLSLNRKERANGWIDYTSVFLKIHRLF